MRRRFRKKSEPVRKKPESVEPEAGDDHDLDLFEEAPAGDGEPAETPATDVKPAALNKIEALTKIARCHVAMQDHRLLAGVAILWAHHLGVRKKNILDLSRLSRSMMYRRIRTTASFIEKLISDSVYLMEPINYPFPSDEDEKGKPVGLICGLCDTEFRTYGGQYSVEIPSVYPQIYRHFRTEHGWWPKTQETPKASDEYLHLLESSDLLARAEGRPGIFPAEEPSATFGDEYRLIETTRTLRGSGLQLETVVSDIIARENIRRTTRYDELLHGLEQDAALSEILRHTREESRYRELRDVRIYQAYQLQVTTAAIAKVLGKAHKTIRRWQSRGQLAYERSRPLPGQTLDTMSSVPTARHETRYEKLPDARLSATCTNCTLRLVWNSNMADWLDLQFERHRADRDRDWYLQ